MNDTQPISAPAIPKGVGRFFTVLVFADYLAGLFAILSLFSRVGTPNLLTLSTLVLFLGGVSAFVQGYGLINKEKWIIPGLIIGTGISALSSLVWIVALLYTLHLSAGLGVFTFLFVVGVTLVLPIIISTLVWKYRHSFKGAYFHPVFSTILGLAIVSGIIIAGGLISRTLHPSPYASEMVTLLNGGNGPVLSASSTLPTDFTITPAPGWSEKSASGLVVQVASPDNAAAVIVIKIAASPADTLDSLQAQDAAANNASTHGLPLEKTVLNGYDALVAEGTFGNSRGMQYFVVGNKYVYEIVVTAPATTTAYDKDLNLTLSSFRLR